MKTKMNPNRIFLWLLAVLLPAGSVHAKTYSFTGMYNSSWGYTLNWYQNQMPPSVLATTDTVYLNGTCDIGNSVTCNGTIIGNFLQTTISGSLTISSSGLVRLNGVIIRGTMNVGGPLEINGSTEVRGVLNIQTNTTLSNAIYNYTQINISSGTALTVDYLLDNRSGASLNISGQLILQTAGLLNIGYVTINNGGSIRCIGSGISNGFNLYNSGTISLESGSQINNSANFNLNSLGVLKGDGNIWNGGTFTNYSNSFISPGLNGPASFNISGSSANFFPGGSVFQCDINGAAAGSGYDQLNFSKPVTLSSARLVVNWGSFTPSIGQSFTIMTFPSGTGQFSAVTIPPVSGVGFITEYNTTSVVIRVIWALPLQLIRFSGETIRNNEISLNWTTDQEQYAEGFEIQQSADGSRFTPIGHRAAQNNSGRQQYSFNCVQPAERMYYRLKLTDRNGNFRFSSIITIHNGRAEMVRVSPNPGTNKVQIETNSTYTAVTVYDAGGHLIKEFSPTLNHTYPVSDLKSGIYFFHIKGEINSRPIKWIKP